MDNGNVQEFIEVWRSEFGETLSEADASLRLHQLVMLYQRLLEIDPQGFENDMGGDGDLGTSERSSS